MRIIKFTRDCKDYTIRAIKNHIISNLEILVPNRYRMMYSGFEGWFANNYYLDFDNDSIDRCDNKIIIVNLDPNPIDYILMANKNKDQIIEDYKYIVANCSIITIYLNNDKSLYDVEIAYEINNGTDIPHLEEISLLYEDDKFCDMDITSTNY